MKTTAKIAKAILISFVHASVMLVITASLSFAIPWDPDLVDDTKDKRTCLLTKQLADPVMKEDYLLAVAFLKNPRNFRVVGDAGSMYAGAIPVSYSPSEPPAMLDRMSFECLTCHDGTSATLAEVRFQSSETTNNYADITKNHPIGIDYEEAMSRHPGQYRSIDSLDRRISLLDGKLGCITCHDSINPEVGHLSMNNDGSALCLECHIR
ncbi:MAG: hypothetical protein HYS23_00280 [Geobacter sp.]|nr:hypothetical protein [Geobacter sp.]